MAQKKISKTRQEIHKIYEENELAGLIQNKTRARSFSIGTTTGGIIELSMRGDYSSLWYHIQPVEAVEAIHQLASAIGVEIAMRPRDDFATWRGWDSSLPPSIHWVGAAPWQITEEERKRLQEIRSKEVKSIEQAKENVE